jgi:hypothetical protein
MKILFALVSFIVLVESAGAASFTNTVSVDSFVRASAPTLNYGSAGSLAVSGPNAVNGSGVANGVFDSFIRFNTAAMVASFNALCGVNDLRAGGEVSFYLTAVDPGIGFIMDSRNFVTNSLRPVLELSAVPRPGIVGIQLSGTDLLLTATNGAAGTAYDVLASTNLTLPLSQWLSVATNVLSASGNFSFTLTNAASDEAPARQYFILSTH